jgi:hypothetical protein
MAAAERITSAGVWPAKPQLEVLHDWAGADQSDPAQRITFAIEISTDGVQWTHWAGGTIGGHASQSALSGYPGLTSPSMRVTAPPPGVQARIRETPEATIASGVVVR